MKKLDQYIGYIETVLVNRNIDNEDTEWQRNAEFKKFINSSEPLCITDSVTLGIDAPELLLMVKISDETLTDQRLIAVKNTITEQVRAIASRNPKERQDTFKVVNILFFVSSIDARIKLSHAFAPQNTGDLMKAFKESSSANRINTIFYLDKDVSMEEIKIPNVRRYEMVMMPPPDIDIEIPKKADSVTLKGYVFTANLFDIVSLYNAVGDQLFRKNVRLGIEDKLDVDKSILETLTNKPEAFWFRNNGITILVEEPNLMLDRVGEIVLKDLNTADLRFSVINGAQTITTASEFFYSPSNKKRAELSSTAKVIVKIIHIQDKNPREAEKEAKNISIALNRQKPIKTEDIAFTNDFVGLMNNYLEANTNYILVRRGEESAPNRKAYSLISFAKARKACSGDPGQARGNSTASLLKISSETSQFSDHDIFVPKWYSASESERESVFGKYYSPVFFAMELAEKCQSVSKNTKVAGAKGNIIKNGMWYFIAYIVYLLNDSNDENYSNFTYSADRITADGLRDLFEQFAEFYCRALNATEMSTISNVFKKSDKYKELKKSRCIGSPFYQNTCRLFGKNETALLDPVSEPNKSDQFAARTSAKETAEFQVVFDGETKSVPTVTDAFIYTVQQCLEKALRSIEPKEIPPVSFLTTDANLRTGYFKSRSAISVCGITVYVGKHSNSVDKINQLKRLCGLLSVKPNTVMWKNGNLITFEY